MLKDINYQRVVLKCKNGLRFSHILSKNGSELVLPSCFLYLLNTSFVSKEGSRLHYKASQFSQKYSYPNSLCSYPGPQADFTVQQI